MATLADVKKVWEDVQMNLALFGGATAFKKEFGDRITEIGRAIMDGLDLAPFRDFGTLLSLPLTTELPTDAGRLFKELKVWLRSRDDSSAR